MTLPRSTNAGRGELAGPARTARQVRVMDVRVEELAPGTLRLSLPTVAPGWSGVATSLPQLRGLLASAFTEAQVSAHAVWRGHPYLGVDSDAYRRPLRRRRGHRADVHDPRDWRVAPDGRWVAPGAGRSRLWDPDSQVVQRVKQRRIRLGLPAVPETVGE